MLVFITGGDYYTDTGRCSDISTNEQKNDWFLRLNPNGTEYSVESQILTNLLLGRIPVIVDNTITPPHPVMETSAELLYLLKFADKEDKFGFKDELEKSECLQWLFFWHGSGAPYQGNLGFFNRAAEKIHCKSHYKPQHLAFTTVILTSLSIKLPLNASVKRPCGSLVFWKSDCLASTPASHVTTWRGTAKENIPLLILEHGPG